MMNNRLSARIPMAMFTVNIKLAKRRRSFVLLLARPRFSPTDPISCCFATKALAPRRSHLTIGAGGSDMKKIHTHTLNMEIAGREFFAMTAR
jgi:oligogalacturonide lyase